MSLRLPMPRSLMRLGPVHVVVAAPSAALRTSLVAWLQRSRRVKIVRAVATASELGRELLELVGVDAIDPAHCEGELQSRFDDPRAAAADLVERSLA